MDSTDGASREGLLDDNVVRLPRDWLGPREELIPFGKSEDGQSGAAVPPTAEDFWGEGSASVQDALRAPPSPADSRAALVAVAPARWSFWFAQRRTRVISFAAALTAVVIAVALLGTGGGPGSSPHRQVVAGAVSHSATFAGAGSGLKPAARARTLERALGHRTSDTRPHHAIERAHSRPRRVTASTAGTQARQSASAAATPTASAQVFSPAPAPEPAPSTSESSAGVSNQTVTSDQPTMNSGSQSTPSSNNQPVLGAAGALALGSSPDS
jgi:hypothetical protein